MRAVWEIASKPGPAGRLRFTHFGRLVRIPRRQIRLLTLGQHCFLVGKSNAQPSANNRHRPPTMRLKAHTGVMCWQVTGVSALLFCSQRWSYTQNGDLNRLFGSL